jgi:D-aspartate ligase
MNDQGRPAAFVLGLGPNGYGHVRSLAREGVPIVGFYNSSEQFGRLSRFVRAHFLALSLAPERIGATLIECGSRFPGKRVLFATNDQFALLLAQCREQLSQHFAFHWVSAESMSKIVDKSEMSRLCQQAGVLCPRTHITEATEDIARTARDFPFPCLIKPVRSFRTTFLPDTKNFVADSPRTLLAFYEQNPGLLGTTLWQELIEGSDQDIYQCNILIRESGEVGALFGVRKGRQYPPGYGVMCFGQSEENEIVASQALRLLRFLHYRGFASLEFKRQPRDNRYYFIEMNPRLPWYCALFADAGVNLPYLAYLDLTGNSEFENLNRRQQNGVSWISFRHDLGSFLRNRRNHRYSALQWLRSVFTARSFAWWSLRDPVPFMRATVEMLGVAMRWGNRRG